ncbi:sensor histidine kinase [Streptomyces katsurahamanus]|uniref:histidine kinase n=1 Tax=Streptomyces katsurahamanus TaxID=2577098 RepID=A0ABW9NRZ4_9ACTN|nr:histidine kinase [Streptomyces katsurahamanus]MQS36046.1 sensor histidine kinase [Streptomyces katsurahamanus]
MTRTEYPWLLPSAMAGPTDPEPPGAGPIGPGPARGRPRRTVRDWVVDTTLFLIAAFVGVLAAEASDRINDGSAVVLFDQLTAASACCALWLRRRWPVGLAAVLAVVSLAAPTAGGAMLAGLFSLAVHRPFRPVALIGALALLSACLQPVARPDPTMSPLGSVLAGVTLVLLAIGWGMLIRARRQLVAVLRERAHRAEAEAGLRAEQAQRLAREAIAREMHDVLAHRLTLLSVHAGALEFRPDAPPAEVARAAGVIRDSAHEALQDLRQIIGVLRASDEGDGPDRPQPTLATLDLLVTESRDAGMRVVLDNAIADPAAVPAAVGRTVYRIAQECLTNARKHAPGAEVTLALRGGPGDGVTVVVDNPAPVGEPGAVPGSGQGLIGLTERAALAGGTLQHGRTGEGGFHVRAWLPWPV